MRIKFGKSSFVIPEGFEIQKDSCLTGSDFSKSDNPQRGSGYVVVLTKKGTGFSNKITYIFNKSAINPNHYSPVITLNSILASEIVNPLEYLNKAKEVYISSLSKTGRYKFCEANKLGSYPAAKMQLEFGGVLRLTYLGLVWQWERVFFHAALITPLLRVEEGWKNLYEFAESFLWEG